jgi:hypothetical protein
MNKTMERTYKIINDEHPMEAAYSIRKLHSTTNHKCTCEKPESLEPNGYCYARDKSGSYVKPCEIGKSLEDILSGADIIG